MEIAPKYMTPYLQLGVNRHNYGRVRVCALYLTFCITTAILTNERTNNERNSPRVVIPAHVVASLYGGTNASDRRGYCLVWKADLNSEWYHVQSPQRMIVLLGTNLVVHSLHTHTHTHLSARAIIRQRRRSAIHLRGLQQYGSVPSLAAPYRRFK